MPAPKKNIAGYIAKAVAKKSIPKKSVVKVQPKPRAKVANPKSNVKVMYPSTKGIFPGINGGKPVEKMPTRAEILKEGWKPYKAKKK